MSRFSTLPSKTKSQIREWVQTSVATLFARAASNNFQHYNDNFAEVAAYTIESTIFIYLTIARRHQDLAQEYASIQARGFAGKMMNHYHGLVDDDNN